MHILLFLSPRMRTTSQNPEYNSASASDPSHIFSHFQVLATCMASCINAYVGPALGCLIICAFSTAGPSSCIIAEAIDSTSTVLHACDHNIHIKLSMRWTGIGSQISCLCVDPTVECLISYASSMVGPSSIVVNHCRGGGQHAYEY